MSVNREQVRREADDYPVKAFSDRERKLARHCLALLAELEQAEQHIKALDEDIAFTARTLSEQLDLTNVAEDERLAALQVRLAKVPALVEALKEVTAHAEASDYDRWNSHGISTDPGYGEPDEITKRAQAVIAAWEAE